MKTKEAKARRILRNSLKEIRKLGFNIIIPCNSPTVKRIPLTRVENAELEPVSPEYKRAKKSKDQTKEESR